MKRLAQSLSDTFGVRTGYTDAAGKRRVTKPRKPKARDPFEIAQELRTKIEALVGHPEQVPLLFAALDGVPAGDRYEAFRLLDEQPGRFINYGYPNDTGWHATLRQCRNSPLWGRQLFAAINQETA